MKTSADAPLGGTHRLTAAPAFPACTGVRFLVDNEQALFAGNENGYVYEISCPFATQAAANRLLTKLQNFVYRPFTAEAAVINPACELGDTIAVPDGLGGTFLSGLFSSDLVFDSICAASVAAPDEAFAPPVRTSVGREKASGNTVPLGSTIPPAAVRLRFSHAIGALPSAFGLRCLAGVCLVSVLNFASRFRTIQSA